VYRRINHVIVGGEAGSDLDWRNGATDLMEFQNDFLAMDHADRDVAALRSRRRTKQANRWGWFQQRRFQSRRSHPTIVLENREIVLAPAR
jgi:hypothetical protein